MSAINFGSSVSLRDFAMAIHTVGRDVTIIGQGEPGIGKSAMLKFVGEMNPDMQTAYIDCTLLDLGDFALPFTETVENKLTGVNKIHEVRTKRKVHASHRQAGHHHAGRDWQGNEVGEECSANPDA
jgi:hypothetical protein